MPKLDEISIRTTAVGRNIPLATTARGALAFVEAIKTLKSAGTVSVTPLQQFHAELGHPG
jgi:hypothetical protein